MTNYRIPHPKLEIGEIIDESGSCWMRSEIQDESSTYPDNYYYIPLECCCDTVDGAGYTFNDEYGDCDYCNNVIRQINGHNDDLPRNTSKLISPNIDFDGG